MESTEASAALEAWRRAIGPSRVLTGGQTAQTLANCSDFRRFVEIVLRPRHASQIPEIVRVANRRRIPLYPFSTGKNWGLGSRLPVEDGCVLVDLSELDRILAIDGRHGTVTIEPGVTQAQLAAELRRQQLPFRLNFTGAAAETSVLGNALDAGIGILGPRFDDVLELEAVLGSGETISIQSPRKAGPDLRGLFLQSNFGIVTRAKIKLHPKPECSEILSLPMLNEAVFRRRVFELPSLINRGILEPTVRIANRRRLQSILAPNAARKLVSGPVRRTDLIDGLAGAELPAWTAIARLEGPAELVRVRKAELNDWRKQKLDQPDSPNDDACRAVEWESNAEIDFSGRIDLDSGTAGILFALPLLPLEPEPMLKLDRLAREACQSANLNPAITFNLLNRSDVEGVVSVCFNRSDAGMAKLARKTMHRLHDVIEQAGFPLMRAGIEDMNRVETSSVASRIKAALDPNGIIAPGRYVST